MDFCASDRAAYEKLLEDAPFKLPKGWAWCRLDAVCEIRGGKRIPAGRKLTETDTGHKYIRVSDMRDGSVCARHLLFVPPDIYPSISKYIIKKEDVFITVAGTLGRVGKIPPELDGANLTENADRLILNGAIIQDWLIYVLNSQHVKDQITSAYTQVGQPKLAIAKLAQFTMPLPPLAEQKKAVARINELYKVADSFGEAAAGLEAMAKRLDKMILDLAIRGKLMPQNPNDEPASELLKRIEATSHKSPCKNHEMSIDPPFEAPCKWTWCRLGDICDILDSRRKPVTKAKRTPGPYPYYGATCIQDYVAEYIFDEPLVLLGEDGAKWGAGDKSAFCVDGKIWVNNHAHVLRPRGDISRCFIALCLTILDLTPYITGTTVPKLNQEKMYQILIPLPPIAEQKRIVAKIEELRKATQALTM